MQYNNVTKLVIAVAMLLTCAVSHAQDAKYSFSKFFSYSCRVKLYAVRQDGKSYISVALQGGKSIYSETEDFGFKTDPVMTLTTYNGDVVTLPGTNLGFKQKSNWSVTDGRNSEPLFKPIATAWFEITGAQIEKLNDGISNIHITTTPYEHEKKFSKDKIGKKLYKAFCNKK